MDRQVELGVITAERRDEQLQKLGRRNLKEDNEGEGRS